MNSLHTALPVRAAFSQRNIIGIKNYVMPTNVHDGWTVSPVSLISILIKRLMHLSGEVKLYLSSVTVNFEEANDVSS